MNKLFLLFIFGCLLSFQLSAEYEEDFCEPAEPVAEFCRYPVYVGIFGGIDQLLMCGDKASILYHPKFMCGFCIGTQLNQYFRTEGEFAYRKSTVFDYYTSLKLKVYSVMANLCLDIPIGRLKPYLGFGLGSANTTFRLVYTDGGEGIGSWRHQKFAWQGFCGFNYQICNKTDLGLRWNFLSSEKGDVYHESLVLGLNQYF